MLYIPGVLRHTVMPGLQLGLTRKDIQHLSINRLYEHRQKKR